MMKNFLISASLVFVISGCSAIQDIQNPPSQSNMSVSEIIDSHVYMSIDPKSSPSFEKETKAGKRQVFWEDLTNKELNPELPLERSFVSILREDVDGSLGFASAKLTGNAGLYKIIVDYAKYRDEKIGVDQIPCRVGVGVRIVAHVRTTQANLDLSSLFAIGYAAKAGYLTGQIEVIKIGIDSPGLSMVLPPPADITDASLQNALQAVAAIRAKLYDSDTILRPHVISVQYQPEIHIKTKIIFGETKPPISLTGKTWYGYAREYSGIQIKSEVQSSDRVIFDNNQDSLSGEISTQGAELAREWDFDGIYKYDTLILRTNTKKPVDRKGIASYILRGDATKGSFIGYWVGYDPERKKILACPYVLTTEPQRSKVNQSFGSWLDKPCY